MDNNDDLDAEYQSDSGFIFLGGAIFFLLVLSFLVAIGFILHYLELI